MLEDVSTSGTDQGLVDAPGLKPKVSVVVATHNRLERLKTLLGALDRQTLDRDQFEVIVIDNGTSDGTSDFLSTAVGIKVLRREVSNGPAEARELGWRQAQADLIAFTDDDCRPEPEWLEEALDAHLSAPGSIVQGLTRPDPYEEHLMVHPLARTIRVDGLGPFFQTCNVLYPKSVLNATGGFDTTISGRACEDVDLAMRALSTGCGAVFAREAVVNHAVEVRSTWEAVREARRWGMLVELVGRHPQIRRVFPWRGLAWRETHARLLIATVGIALCALTGRRAFLLWCVPYLSYRNGWSPKGVLRTLTTLHKLLPVDAAELSVLARESAKRRRIFI